MAKYDFDDPLVWKKISADRLESHILNGHLRRPYVMKRLGIPTFDIELAQYRRYEMGEEEFDLSNSARRCLQLLADGDRSISNFVAHDSSFSFYDEYSLGNYRADIVNSLRYMRKNMLLRDFTQKDYSDLEAFDSIVTVRFNTVDVPFTPIFDSSMPSHVELLQRIVDDDLEEKYARRAASR